MTEKLPPGLVAMQSAMNAIFGAIDPSRPVPASAESIATAQRAARHEMILDWEQRGLLDCPACKGDRFYKCGHCGQKATRNIRTSFQYFGWVAADDATYDGPGSPLGQGKTEHEAIDDLREQMEEREQERANRKAAKEKLCPICLYPEHDPRCVHWEQA